MSAISLRSVNGQSTSSLTYFQTNPNTGLALGTLVSPGGNALGYTSSTTPWASTPTASFQPSSSCVTVNSDGSITATARCHLSIAWSATFYVSSGTASAGCIIAPSTSSNEAAYSQTRGQTVILYNNGTVSLNTSAQVLPTVTAEFIANPGDVYNCLVTGTASAMMRQGILRICTKPCIN